MDGSGTKVGKKKKIQMKEFLHLRHELACGKNDWIEDKTGLIHCKNQMVGRNLRIVAHKKGLIQDKSGKFNQLLPQ